jgi:hypothetical protein
MVQSPDSATAAATFDALPTQISVLGRAGSEAVVNADHVLSPRRKLVLFAVPVADRLVVPMLVSDAPEPEKVVAVTVPLTFKAPLNVLVPIATCPDQVDVAPATVPVSVGEAVSTTLPVPVKAVVQAIAVPLVAVQKSLGVNTP